MQFCHFNLVIIFIVFLVILLGFDILKVLLHVYIRFITLSFGFVVFVPQVKLN